MTPSKLLRTLSNGNDGSSNNPNSFKVIIVPHHPPREIKFILSNIQKNMGCFKPINPTRIRRPPFLLDGLTWNPLHFAH